MFTSADPLVTPQIRRSYRPVFIFFVTYLFVGVHCIEMGRKCGRRLPAVIKDDIRLLGGGCYQSARKQRFFYFRCYVASVTSLDCRHSLTIEPYQPSPSVHATGPSAICINRHFCIGYTFHHDLYSRLYYAGVKRRNRESKF